MEVGRKYYVISICTSEEYAELFKKIIVENNSSKRAVFEDMVDYCIANNKVITGACRPWMIDHKKNIFEAWEHGDQLKDKNGNKLLFQMDIIAYLISLGYNKTTAKKYLYGKDKRNPVYIGLKEGWLERNKQVYILKEIEGK